MEKSETILRKHLLQYRQLIIKIKKKKIIDDPKNSVEAGKISSHEEVNKSSRIIPKISKPSPNHLKTK